MAAAAQMREKIDIPAFPPEAGKIGNRRFRAGQNDKRRPGWQSLAAPDHHETDLAFQIERIEIVEIGDAGQAWDSDRDPSLPERLASWKALRILLRQTC